MAAVTIRIYDRDQDGKLFDLSEDFSPTDFAGTIPRIGDAILQPGVPAPLDRSVHTNRTLWRVVDRIFNPRDLANYVLLVVEEEPITENRKSII